MVAGTLHMLCWMILHPLMADSINWIQLVMFFFKDIELGQRKIGSLGEVRGRSWSCICQDIIYTYTYIDICIHRYTYHTHMDLAKNKQNVLKLLRSKPTGCSFVSL